jgi:hypothetical protein
MPKPNEIAMSRRKDNTVLPINFLIPYKKILSEALPSLTAAASIFPSPAINTIENTQQTSENNSSFKIESNIVFNSCGNVPDGSIGFSVISWDISMILLISGIRSIMDKAERIITRTKRKIIIGLLLSVIKDFFNKLYHLIFHKLLLLNYTI